MTNSEIRNELDSAAMTASACMCAIAQAHTTLSGCRQKLAEKRIIPAWQWEILLHRLDKCFTSLDELQELIDEELDAQHCDMDDAE